MGHLSLFCCSRVLETMKSFWLRRAWEHRNGDAVLWACSELASQWGVSGQLAPSFSGADAAAWPRDSVGPSMRRGRTESPGQGPRRRPDLPPNCEAGWGCLVFNDRVWASWDVRKKQAGKELLQGADAALTFLLPTGYGWGGDGGDGSDHESTEGGWSAFDALRPPQ